MLTTTGACSGQPRTVPLVGVPVEDGVAIVGTRFGSPHHPAWYHNLLANPHAEMERDGTKSAVVARSVPDGPEYDAGCTPRTLSTPASRSTGAGSQRGVFRYSCCSRRPDLHAGLSTIRASRAGAWRQYESVSSSANSDQSVSSSRIIPTTLTPQPARK